MRFAMSNLIQRIKNQGIVLDGRLSVMSENLPQKYETDGTGYRLETWIKAMCEDSPAATVGRSALLFCNSLSYR